MSRPVTRAPRRAATSAALPVPVATSSTSSPAPTQAAATVTGETASIVRAMSG